MNDFIPKLASTIISKNNYEWRPSNFQNLLIEIVHLQETINEALLYRGHRKSDWLLDSTFARSLKKEYNISVAERYSDSILDNVIMQHQFAKQYLQKINNVIINPELQKLEKQRSDTYFEIFSHHQQNPNDPNLHDVKPFGTNYIDFTQDYKIGLFFTNFNRLQKDEGALFVVRQTAIGKVWTKNHSYKEIIQILEKHIEQRPLKMYSDLPLLIYPEKQVKNSLDLKRKRQNAVYFAQMDFRRDLELSWSLLALETGKQVFAKFILPKGTKEQVDIFLNKHDITKQYLFQR